MARINRMVWCDAGWFPHCYGFCPDERTWDYLKTTSKRDLGAYPPLNMKACCTLLQNYKDGNKRVAIVTVCTTNAADTVDLLVHEATHVWQDIREAIGETHPSSEFEAYALQNISANLFSAYQKTRGRLFARVIRPPP